MANQKTEIKRQMDERLRRNRKETRSRKGSFFGRLLFKQIQTGVSSRDVAVFSRDLALLTGLGISLVRSLTILENRSVDSNIRKLISEMLSNVEMGHPLSRVMEKHENVFGDFFVGAVKAGEESGELSKTLNHLADYLDSQALIQSRLRRVMLAPFITLVVATGVIVVLFMFIIPAFAQVYKDAEVTLPLLTQGVLMVGFFIGTFWWLIAIALIAFFLVFYRSGKYLGIQRFTDRLKLNLPIIGGITENLILYRFSRLMSVMMNSGVSIMTSLRLAGPATGNTIIAARLARACDHIDRGETVLKALAEEETFSPMILDTIGVGEEVGAIPIVLERLADYTQREVEDSISNISVMIEPLMTLILGTLVLLIALSMFLPYFNMNQVIF